MKIIKLVMFCAAMMLAGIAQAGSVNINKADVSSLSAELSGVGEKKAQAIVDYRTKNGPFVSVDDLQNIKGISDKTIEKNRENISL